MESIRTLLAKSLFALAIITSSATVQATETQTSGPRWACWYESNDLTLQCLLTRTPTANTQAVRAIDSRLSNLVHTLWTNPAQLAEQRIHIPLMSVPDEMSFARELAESVMCGVRTDCSVSFDSNPDGRAQVRAAAMQAGASEQEVMAELANQGIVVAALAQPTEERRNSRRRRSLQG